MRDSLVAGSTWKPRFRKTLDTYPHFESQHLDFAVLGCDACNLGGRKSTIQGRLSGEPYDPQSYEVSVSFIQIAGSSLEINCSGRRRRTKF